MDVFFGVLIIFGLALIGMAIGGLCGRRCLRGSCGGLSTMRDEHGTPMCELCTDPAPECEAKRSSNTQSPSAAASSDAPAAR